MIVGETEARSEIEEGSKHLNGAAIGSGNRKMGRTAHVTRFEKVNKPEKRQFNGREFELRLTCNNRNKAKGEAKKYRKSGFHTRVIELYPGVFFVYRRSKRA